MNTIDSTVAVKLADLATALTAWTETLGADEAWDLGTALDAAGYAAAAPWAIVTAADVAEMSRVLTALHEGLARVTSEDFAPGAGGEVEHVERVFAAHGAARA